MMRNSYFWGAVALLVATTIGAGIFGIPYMTVQVGYLPGVVWLLALSVLTLAVNLAYALVVTRSTGDGPHQFVGYAKRYLGNWGKRAAALTLLLGQWGVVVAYMVGMGSLLAVILERPQLADSFAGLVYVLVVIVTLFKLKVVAAFEVWLSIGMIATVVLIGFASLDVWSLNQLDLLAIRGDGSLQHALMPFGVIMTALLGATVIPELVQVAKQGGLKTKQILWAVFCGTAVPVVVYLVFQTVVVGVSGLRTSEESIAGLAPFLDPQVVKLAALFGLLAMGSSFISSVYVLKDSFSNDFGLRRFRSWFLAVFPPFLIYVAGLKSFVLALELTGLWLGSLSVLLIIAMYWKVKV